MESTSVFMGQFVSATELVMEVVYQQNIFFLIKIWLSVAYDECWVEWYLLKKTSQELRMLSRSLTVY